MTTNKDNSGITGSKEVTLESKDFIERSEYDKDISHLQKDLSDTITQVDSDLLDSLIYIMLPSCAFYISLT
jgi:hypothetical protein